MKLFKIKIKNKQDLYTHNIAHLFYFDPVHLWCESSDWHCKYILPAIFLFYIN